MEASSTFCLGCGKYMGPSDNNRVTCSNRCRSRLHRKRKALNDWQWPSLSALEMLATARTADEVLEAILTSLGFVLVDDIWRRSGLTHRTFVSKQEDRLHITVLGPESQVVSSRSVLWDQIGLADLAYLLPSQAAM